MIYAWGKREKRTSFNEKFNYSFFYNFLAAEYRPNCTRQSKFHMWDDFARWKETFWKLNMRQCQELDYRTRARGFTAMWYLFVHTHSYPYQFLLFLVIHNILYANNHTGFFDAEILNSKCFSAMFSTICETDFRLLYLKFNKVSS